MAVIPLFQISLPTSARKSVLTSAEVLLSLTASVALSRCARRAVFLNAGFVYTQSLLTKFCNLRLTAHILGSASLAVDIQKSTAIKNSQCATVGKDLQSCLSYELQRQ